MAVDKIEVDDARVSHNYASLNGRRYHYLLGLPKNGEFKATIFLIHGWPDISFGWRYQIPLLLELGLRVVCPDLMGFGRTDAPKVPPASIHLYGFKRAADDIAELARQLEAPRIILGGHDWGGMVVYRTAQWHPTLVTHVFSVCTPYMGRSDAYVSTEDLVKGPLPQFGYQLQLAGPTVEAKITTREQIKMFLSGMYGGRGPNKEVAFSPEQGVLFENLEKLGMTPLLSEKVDSQLQELNYYADEYARNGMHGNLNWYRNRKANYDDELELKATTIEVPTLFILATRDSVLTPAMSKGMERSIPKLTRREVAATHWALWQAPEEVNMHVKEWMESTVLCGRSSL
ncbi:hypothetical protein LTR04_000614 [Oleoguttula sp. CCFEE 6159]|nr:hypothetical protein LTR04_000614 [Oleoguttula sp. CCFEE 6159]